MSLRSNLKTVALWLLPLIFLGVFFFYPLGSILRYSFLRTQAGEASPFWTAITSTEIQKVVGFTFAQAILSTLLTLVVGLPGAFFLARYTFRGKALFQALAGVPFVMPTLVVAAAFNALLGPRGWLNLGLMSVFHLDAAPNQFMNTVTAILVAHVFYNVTIVLRMVGDFWSHLDPRLGQAAQMLGANNLRILRRIYLPLLLPAIAAAGLLVFIFDFTSFGVILVLGGPRCATLEVEIYYQAVSIFNLPLAAVLSLLQLGCTLALSVVYTSLSSRLSRPLSLRPQTFTQRRLTNWRTRLAALAVLGSLLVFLLSPLAALGLRSFMQMGSVRQVSPSAAASGLSTSADRGFTLDFYRELSVNRRQSLFYVPPVTAIATSLAYAAATVLFSLLLGLPASWALARDSKSLANRLLDPVLMLPLGASAVTLGLGFILALARPPLDFRASPLLVPLAHTLVALPFVVRSLAPALRSIRPRLRQAAQVLGASPWQVALHIDLPLIGRAVLVAAIFAFTISMGEFGATALIARPEYPTIPVVIFRLLAQAGELNYGQALALSTILMVVCAAGMLIIERLRIADVGEF